MRKISMLVVLFILWPHAQSASQVSVDSTLARLLVQLNSVQKDSSVGGLVRLDSSLRTFIEDVQRAFPNSHQQFWKNEYSRLGLFIKYYSDQFGYSEEFLVQAHKLNPNSPYRGYTLYSTIFGVRNSSGLGEMPDNDSAIQYVKEFPTGPFAKEVYLVLADFHKDLFIILRDGKEKHAEYKYDCFESYIDKSRIEQQRDQTQALAISFYEKVLKLDPANTYVLEILPKVRAGTVTAWSFCAD